jgi:hypothetical protein
VGAEPHGEHHHIEGFRLDAALFVHKGKLQVAGLRVFRHPGDHGADEAHAVIDPGPLVVAVKALALGPKVDEENGGLHPGVMLLGDDGLLGCIHAAYVRAVFPADGSVPGAHALDPGDFLGFFIIRGPLDVPGMGAGAGK